MKTSFLALCGLLFCFQLSAECNLEGVQCLVAQNDKVGAEACSFNKSVRMLDAILSKNNIKYVIFGSYAAYLSGVPFTAQNFAGDIDVAVSNPTAAITALEKSGCFKAIRRELGVSKMQSKIGTKIDLVEGQDFGFAKFMGSDQYVVKAAGVKIPQPADMLKLTILRPEKRQKDLLTIVYLIAKSNFGETEKNEIINLLVGRGLAAPGSNWAAIWSNATTALGSAQNR